MTLRFFAALSLLLVSTNAAPSRCPGNPSLLGYFDWGTLQNDINALNANSPDATFILCPDTTIRVINGADGNSGLVIDLDPKLDIPPVTIQCGQDGSSTNDCIVRGGWHHLWVVQVGKLNLEGITFDSATRGSVWTGTGAKEIAFKDCIWQDNVYDWDPNPNDPDVNRCPTGCYGAVGGKGGAASFEDCQFLHNEGDTGAVYGDNMAFTFVGCQFTGNTATARDLGKETAPSGSAITLHNPSSALYLANTCFEDNVSYGPATVMVEDTTIQSRQASFSSNQPAFTSLRVNSNNFFDGNKVAQSNHDSAFQWCHNSIYNYIQGDTSDVHFDDCVPAQAATCQRLEEASVDLGLEDSEDEVAQQPGPLESSAKRTTVLGSLVMLVAAWRMV